MWVVSEGIRGGGLYDYLPSQHGRGPFIIHDLFKFCKDTSANLALFTIKLNLNHVSIIDIKNPNRIS